jgi:hypothetical protein
LPLSVVERELEKYNARENKEVRPEGGTWPSTRWSCTKKRDLKAAIKLIIKFKRRERWLMLKAELGPAYIERVSRHCQAGNYSTDMNSKPLTLQEVLA